MKNSSFVRILMPAVIAIAGITLSYGQNRPNIRDLTSQETAKKAQAGEMTRSTSSAPRTMSKLQTHAIGVGLGQTFLRSDFRPNGDNKIAPDLYYTYTASLSFDFLANFHISNHKRQNTEVSISGLALGVKARVYQYDHFAPFVVGGLGFYLPKVKRVLGDQLMSSQTKLTFGNHFGAGADLKLNERVTVGAILHIHNPFDVQQDGQPDVEGSYYKLLLTALYSF